MTETDTNVARLQRLDSCAVSDARDRLGLADAVVVGVPNRTGTAAVAGRVVTVLLGQPTGAPMHRHLCTAAVDNSGAGDVLVIAHQGRTDCAGWGGNLSRAAAARGIGATLIDGATRDVDEARSVGYPVFASAATPRTARGRTVELDWGCPIDFAGISVHTGDYVIADGSGIVFIGADDVAAVLDTAEAIAAHEATMAAAIDAGTPVSQVMGATYEQMTGAQQ